jgi:hypothetical protein
LKQYKILSDTWGKDAVAIVTPVCADHFSVSKEGIALFYRASGPVLSAGGNRQDKLIAASSSWANVTIDDATLAEHAVVGDLSEELLTRLGLTNEEDDAKIRITISLDKE